MRRMLIVGLLAALMIPFVGTVVYAAGMYGPL